MLFGTVTTITSQQQFTSSTLVQKVKDALRDQTAFYLGFVSNQEASGTVTNSVNYVNLNITYHRVPSLYFVKNSYDAGPIIVDGVRVRSGTQFSWLDGSGHPLSAVDTSYEGYERIWHVSGTELSKSKWQKKLPRDFARDIPGAINRDYTYTAAKVDSGASIIAGLKRVCNISLRQQSEFGDILDLGVVRSTVEQDTATIVAPAQWTVGGNTFPFASWSDGVLGNVRTVTPSYHMTLIALYKMHLASNNSAVTLTYGQRRVASGDFGMYRYALYESGGEIWSCWSFGISSPLSSEVRVSQGDGGHRQPSVTAHSNKAYAVWERVSTGQRTIYFAKAVNNSWQAPQIVASYVVTEPYTREARPIIGLYRNEDCDPTALYLAYTSSSGVPVLQSFNDGANWSLLTTGTIQFPSFDDLCSPLYMVAAYNSWAKYKNWESGQSETIPGSDWVNFSGEPDFTENWCWAPQMVRVRYWGSPIYFCWRQVQTCETTHHYVVQQGRHDAGWYDVTAYEVDPELESSPPTLALGPNEHGQMMWSEGNQLKKVTVAIHSGQWGKVEDVGPGKNPLFEFGLPQTTQMLLTAQADPPLTRINATMVDLEADEQEPIEDMEYSRVLFAVDTVGDGSVSVGMTQPTIGGRRILFVAVNDTLPGVDPDKFLDLLTTQAVQPASDNDSLEFRLFVSSDGLERRSIPFGVTIDAMQGQSRLGTALSLSHNLRQGYRSTLVKMPIRNMSGRSIFLRPQAVTLRSLGGNWLFSVAHVYSKPRRNHLLGKEAANCEGIPKEFGLASYPNPFNPSTTVSFDMPLGGNVSLVVYDLLGRKVGELANGIREAGYHSVVWNASEQASGVYFVRFTVADDLGTVKYSKTNKIMLVK